MQFGIDDNNNRSEPLFSGQKARCPLCGGTLVGKCGDIYTWHWQHTNDRECDPWKEHETLWHRKWKAKFPKIQQEVIIERNGEKHIADVKTKNNTVIEFQNSSISTTTIEIREAFYGKMIWVINAQSFKENFKIRSIVSSALRNIEEESSSELEHIKKSYSTFIKDIETKLNEIYSDKNLKESEYNAKKTKKEKLESSKSQIDILHDSIIESIKARQFNEILYLLGFDVKDKIEQLLGEIGKTNAEIKIKRNFLLEIAGYEDFNIENKNFKLVKYESINATNFYRTKAILKTTRKTIFPDIESFNSEMGFKNFNVKSKLYDFAIDLTETVERYESEIIEDSKKVKNLNDNIRHTISENLDTCISTIEKDLSKLSEEKEELTNKVSAQRTRLEKAKIQRDKEIIEYEAEFKQENEEKKFEAMKKHKGFYYFDWKHERKTWLVSDKPIFFDIGKDYLFQKVQNGVLKKISIDDFLKTHE
ncbi:hypothetical protein [Flavobacterium sp. UBA6031]|uniref:hypothetical protein n=1 Tax=Flavobacterium sp. UBA6031 TaxID=1946551 RepID=UPI0025C4E6AC|nr:hypothetical protein [Flavobacterium sp. UBA6031]